MNRSIRLFVRLEFSRYRERVTSLSNAQLNKVTEVSLPVAFFSPLFFPRVRRTITITIITERASGRVLLYIHGVLHNKGPQAGDGRGKIAAKHAIARTDILRSGDVHFESANKSWFDRGLDFNLLNDQ